MYSYGIDGAVYYCVGAVHYRVGVDYCTVGVVRSVIDDWKKRDGCEGEWHCVGK